MQARLTKHKEEKEKMDLDDHGFVGLERSLMVKAKTLDRYVCCMEAESSASTRSCLHVDASDFGND